jgi:hypothetical protein
MAGQNFGGNNGHSYEWQCANNLAQHYAQPVLVAKTWQENATCDQFLRVQITTGAVQGWLVLRDSIANFAAQCVAAGKTQVAFIWDQGSSEALTVNAALTPALQQNTLSVFASIRALFRAFGIGRVRFYVMQQNINFAGQAGIDNAQLASVRAQEAALVIADGDSSLLNCDDIVMASGFHYSNGQTNVIGARFATQIFADFAGAQPGFVTPPTVEQIFASTPGKLLNHLLATSGIGVGVGSQIPLWTDATGNGRNGMQATVLKQPTLISLGGAARGVQFDGVNSDLPIVSMTLPTPSVAPLWTWEVARVDNWVSGGRVWGGAAANPALVMFASPNQMQAYNGGSLNGNQQAPNGVFKRYEIYFSNSAAPHVEAYNGVTGGDYIKTGIAFNDQLNMGNSAVGDIHLGFGLANPGAVTLRDEIRCNALPTKAQFDALCGYYTFNYGTSVGTT